ncbi:MarR family winged helix-turn-helix transcriptional regulator [Arthrobacter sp. JSM 101049]|uniref:MarR family winged helix-turn-helix transcriptional regulator n=1 Tax=Arthrobacter sp. JSM 101049 TaxID=929097 RepID=UPI00356A52FE
MKADDYSNPRVDRGDYRRYLAAVTLFHQAAADAVGLSGTDYQASNLLDLDGPMTSGDLAGRLGLSTGATTRLVDRLIAIGVAIRTEDPADRRRNLIAHSGHLPAALDGVLRRVRLPIQDALAELTADQRNGVSAYLTAATQAYTVAARTLRTPGNS